MDSNHRCLGVGQESSPLDHGTVGNFGFWIADFGFDGPVRRFFNPQPEIPNPQLFSGLTGNRTRISGLQDRRLPVGP